MKKTQQDDPYMKLISKPEISFWVPLLVPIIAWAVSFGTLYSRVDLIIKNQEQQYTMWLNLEKRVGANELSIAKAEQFHAEIKNVLNLR